MMMKKKSNKWLSGTKALYLLPVALVAVAAFATPKVSKNLEAVIDGKVNVNVLNDQNISSKNVENQAEVDEITPTLTSQEAIVLDEEPKRAVIAIDEMAPEVELEASGGVNLKTIGKIAATGVERISVGSLTHAASSLDIGLDWEPVN